MGRVGVLVALMPLLLPLLAALCTAAAPRTGGAAHVAREALHDATRHPRKVVLNEHVIDTMHAEPFVQRPAVRRDGAPLTHGGALQQFLVHHNGPLTSEDRRYYERECAHEVSVGAYLPHNTWLVVGSETRVYQCLAHQPRVLWIGAFHTQYKFSAAATVDVVDDAAVVAAVHGTADTRFTMDGTAPAAAARHSRLVELLVHAPPTPRFADARVAAPVMRRWAAALADAGVAAEVVEMAPRRAVVRADEHALAETVAVLAEQPLVHWIEQRQRAALLNYDAQFLTEGNVGTPFAFDFDAVDLQHDDGSRWMWQHGVTGAHELVSVADTGLDYKVCHMYDQETSVTPVLGNHTVVMESGTAHSRHRKVAAYWAFSDSRDLPNGHGTHHVGTILGSPWELSAGNASLAERYGGIAPDARVLFMDIQDSADQSEALHTFTDVAEEYFSWAYANGAYISSNSWGVVSQTDATRNRYGAAAQDIDAFVHGHPLFLPVFAAGNDGTANGGARNLVGTATSKNALVVGASQNSAQSFHEANKYNNEVCARCSSDTARCTDCWEALVDDMPFLGPSNMATFSSRGPTADGRIKPDMVAPGQWLASTRAGLTSPQCTNAVNATQLLQTFGPDTRLEAEPPVGFKRAVGIKFQRTGSELNADLVDLGCGTVTGAAAFFAGDGPERVLETNWMNLEGGAFLDFWIKRGSGSGSTKCDEPEGDELLRLQWAPIAGAWTTIETWPGATETNDPLAGRGWFRVEIELTAEHPAALREVRLRWIMQQGLNVIQEDLDVWGLDDVHIMSARSPDLMLLSLEGTSVSTPVAAGNAVLVRQYFDQGFYPSGYRKRTDSFAPSAALIKAVLLNSGVELTGRVDEDGEGAYRLLNETQHVQGFGLMHLDEQRMPFVEAVSRDRRLMVAKTLTRQDNGLYDFAVANGDTVEFRFWMVGSEPVRVTLAWTDPAAALASAQSVALVNNLDLDMVANVTLLWRGNEGVPGAAVPDARNNVEQINVAAPPAGMLYTVRVHGTSVPSGDAQPFALVINGHVDGVPHTPAAPSLASGGRDQVSLVLEWPATPVPFGSEVQEYYLEMAAPGGDFVGVAPIPVLNRRVVCDNTTCTFRQLDLVPKTEYRFRVQAENANTRSDWSEVAAITTSAPPEQMAPPTAVDITSTSIELAWTAPNDNLDPICTYELQQAVQPPASEPPKYKTVFGGAPATRQPGDPPCTPPATTLLLENLPPSTVFLFRIRAYNQQGPSTYSVNATIATSSGPLQPQPVFLVDRTGRTLTVGWHKPGDNGSPVTGFVLEMKDGSPPAAGEDEPAFEIVYTGGEKTRTISNLIPVSPYIFRVKAFNVKGESEYSEESTILTASDIANKPSTPAVRGAPTATAVTVGWSEPEDNGATIYSYELQMAGGFTLGASPSGTRRRQTDEEFRNVFTGNLLEFTKQGLAPNTDYRFRYRAVNFRGASEYSDPIAAHTAVGEEESAAPVRVAPLGVAMLVLMALLCMFVM